MEVSCFGIRQFIYAPENKFEGDFGCMRPSGPACMRPVCVSGGCVEAVGGKSEDVAACVDLWPAVIAGAGLLQLAFVSCVDVFGLKTPK